MFNNKMRIQTNWEEIAKESLMYIICADLKENKIYAETVGIAKLNKPAHVIIIHEGKGEKLGKEYYDNITEQELLEKSENDGMSIMKETADKFKANYDEVSAILIERINVSL